MRRLPTKVLAEQQVQESMARLRAEAYHIREREHVAQIERALNEATDEISKLKEVMERDSTMKDMATTQLRKKLAAANNLNRLLQAKAPKCTAHLSSMRGADIVQRAFVNMDRAEMFPESAAHAAAQKEPHTPTAQTQAAQAQIAQAQAPFEQQSELLDSEAMERLEAVWKQKRAQAQSKCSSQVGLGQSSLLRNPASTWLQPYSSFGSNGAWRVAESSFNNDRRGGGGGSGGSSGSSSGDSGGDGRGIRSGLGGISSGLGGGHGICTHGANSSRIWRPPIRPIPQAHNQRLSSQPDAIQMVEMDTSPPASPICIPQTPPRELEEVGSSPSSVYIPETPNTVRDG